MRDTTLVPDGGRPGTIRHPLAPGVLPSGTNVASWDA
jgi:hypothetical protein